MIDLVQRCLITIALTLSLSACVNSPATPEQPDTRIRFERIASGNTSGMTLSKQLVINQANEWSELWQIHSSTAPSALPKVNFTHEMVIAVFLGEFPTGGYVVNIERIDQQPDHVQVHCTLQRPDRRAVTTMALTQPFVIVKAPRTTLPVRFFFTEK